MSESARIIQPVGEGKSFFRCRTADEIANIHQNGRRLIEEAQAARQQWLDAHARMTRAQDKIGRSHSSEESAADTVEAGRLLQEELEAHSRSKLALERELARCQRLEDEVLAIQDQERARLARDLHDGIAQNLVAISLLLELHLRQLKDLGPESGAVRSGQNLVEILDQTVQEMRDLSHGLSGLETGDQGENLCPAFHTLAERLNASESVRCVVVCPDPPVLGSVNATHLYRIAQEAVSNALRHGRAGRIEIRFARVKGAKGQWRLTVTDDGVGLAEDAVPDSGGLGMRSMAYRAAVLGGVLEVRQANPTRDRPGTVVSCTFP